MNATSEFDREIRWSMVVSILMIVAGCLAIIMPAISGIAVAVFVGWLLIVAGVGHWVYTWHRRHRSGKLWGWLLGILFIIIGARMLMFPVVALASLTLLLGIYLLVDAALEFIVAFRYRPLNGWGWLFFDGLIALALGLIILLRWPHSTLWVIGTLVGVSIFFAGVSRFMVSLGARNAAGSMDQLTPVR
ncbi:MAG TPA: DUF308 domain-containing protein [Verrucomicrobiae bacterium]|jgi:uncharacterized membrane protein HdeD (DUF308 family)|nr:DUF308 domain-containing protein [Verrucomicrobiae bacterium]